MNSAHAGADGRLEPTLPVKGESGSMLRAELPLLAAIFLDLMGFGMTFPDVQLRAQDYGATGWVIGVILASYYVVQMLASPRWGRLSDHVGRKPVILVCGLLSAGSMVIYALGHSMEAMLFSRLTAGLGAANVAVAQAYVADALPESARPAALARLSAAVSAGLVAGPALGGFLAAAGGNYLLGMSAAAISGFGVLMLTIFLPGVESEERKDHSAGSRLRLTANPIILRLAVIASIGWFSLACLEGTFGRLIHRNLGYGQLEFGLLLSLEAGVALVQGLLFGRMARRFRLPRLLRVGYALQAIGLLVMPFAPGIAVLAGACVLFGLGLGIAGPSINALASSMVGPQEQGELFGKLQSCRASGFLIGPILGGWLFDLRAAAPYVAAGAIMGSAAGFSLRRFEGPDAALRALTDDKSGSGD